MMPEAVDISCPHYLVFPFIVEVDNLGKPGRAVHFKKRLCIVGWSLKQKFTKGGRDKKDMCMGAILITKACMMFSGQINSIDGDNEPNLVVASVWSSLNICGNDGQYEIRFHVEHQKKLNWHRVMLL